MAAIIMFIEAPVEHEGWRIGLYTKYPWIFIYCYSDYRLKYTVHVDIQDNSQKYIMN